MEFRLFGAFEFDDGERLVRIPGGRPRALLSIMLLNSGKVLSTQRLIELLWPEAATPARGSLHVLMARLRALLEPGGAPYRLLCTRPPGYVLVVDPEQIDIRRFERLATLGRNELAKGNPTVAARALASALQLCRGPVLAGQEEAKWAVGEARRLEELRLLATEDWAWAELQSGSTANLIHELAANVEVHPLRERLLGALMVALYRAGRSAEAVDAYHNIRALLRDSRAIEPGPQLQHIFKQVLTQSPALRSSAPLNVVQGNLPRTLLPLMGRNREVGSIGDELGHLPLITLTGPGGIGKTSLALEIAAKSRERFRDGCWFIGLDVVGDEHSVPWTVLSALGLQGESVRDPLRAIQAHLSDRHALLVVDNCEHVLDAAAELVHALLLMCRDLAVLATSRQPLGLPEETVAAIGPLDPSTDGAELFRARALAAGASKEELNGAGPAIERICTRLDGIPLAIELVASWVPSVGLTGLATGLADMLSQLGPVRGRPERHHSLRAALDWSYSQLTPVGQAALRRLAFFADVSPEAAATVVCLPPVESVYVAGLLRDLASRSLVLAEQPEIALRYRLLQPMRDFAAEQLVAAGEEQAITARFIAHAAEMAAVHGSAVRGHSHEQAMHILDLEENNLRRALDLALGTDSSLAQALAADLGDYWFIRGRMSEASDRLRSATSMAAAPSRTRASALVSLSMIQMATDIEGARHTARTAKSIADVVDARDLSARAVMCQAIAAYTEGDYQASLRLARKAKHIGGATGNTRAMAETTLVLAVAEVYLLAHAPALAHAQAAIELFESDGDAWGVADASIIAADAALGLDDVSYARALIDNSIAVFEGFGDRNSWTMALGFLSKLLLRDGDHDGAEVVLQRALEAARATSNTYAEILTVDQLARVAIYRGDADAAGAWWAEVIQLQLTRGSPESAIRARLEQADLAARNLPGFDPAWLLADARRIANEYELRSILPTSALQ